MNRRGRPVSAGRPVCRSSAGDPALQLDSQPSIAAATRSAAAGASGTSPWRKKANVSMLARPPTGAPAPRSRRARRLRRAARGSGVRPARPPAIVVDAHGARRGEPLLDAVPARIPEVERVADARIGRAEQQLEKAVVPRPLDDDADAAEPVAEAAHPLLERREPPLEAVGCLDREPEAVGHLRRPRAELLLRRQPVLGRVQLDGGELRRVVRRGTRCGRARPGRSPAARTDSPSRRCRRAACSRQGRAGRSGRRRTAARPPARGARARPPRRRRRRRREQRVAVDVRIDLGQQELVGERQRRRVDLGAADHEHLRRRRRRGRRASSSDPTRSAPSPYHFAFRVTTMLRRPGQRPEAVGDRVPRSPAHYDRMAHRDLAEPCHVLRDPPGNAVVATDHATVGDRCDERDSHTAIGARIAGWWA